MCFRGVKLFGPFSNSVVAFAVVYEVRSVVEQKVERIHQTILWDGEVMLEFGVHGPLRCCLLYTSDAADE